MRSTRFRKMLSSLFVAFCAGSVIVALVPLALRGVRYRPQSAAQMLRRNLLIYGIGGLVAPFPCIWAIDRILGLLHLA